MTKKKKNQYKIKQILRGIVLFLFITMSLYHVFFNEFSPKQVAHKKTYKPIIFERNDNQDLLLKRFEKDEISKSEFLEAFKNQTKFSKEKINNYNYKKKELAIEHSFNGRNSFHYWFFVFGLSFSFFILSLRFAYKIVKKSEKGYLKKSLIFESIGWIGISLFWILHTVFKKTDDLPSLVYILVWFSLSIIIGISVFFSIKYFVNRKEHTLKSYKQSIINLIELIGDIRVNHYFHMAAKATNKDNEKVIVKDSEIMDNKIFTTLEKVADGKE